ncbi:hypothetical protein E2C01_032468 [Portunus trituberculatus]|uniref:Uncharacterized protein n=1 Tax=Portunus trituberculatus TaxID=210409 RepID=A0A5B7EVC5_PORTR|nr:hypothetical protein [Portunus trituberculatus]
MRSTTQQPSSNLLVLFGLAAKRACWLQVFWKLRRIKALSYYLPPLQRIPATVTGLASPSWMKARPVKKKHKNTKDGTTKTDILQFLALHHVYATRTITTTDGYVMLTRTDDDTDKILLKDITRQLKTKGFEPHIPPEMKAKRSIIMPRLDDFIYQNTKEEIREELVHNNN